MVTAKKREHNYLAESDYWDQFSVQELWETSEPDDEDIKFIDARPKKAISIRLTESMIAEGKRVAKDLGLGYQTLFRMWLMDGLRRHRLRELAERRRPRTAARKSPGAFRAARK